MWDQYIDLLNLPLYDPFIHQILLESQFSPNIDWKAPDDYDKCWKDDIDVDKKHIYD